MRDFFNLLEMEIDDEICSYFKLSFSHIVSLICIEICEIVVDRCDILIFDLVDQRWKNEMFALENILQIFKLEQIGRSPNIWLLRICDVHSSPTASMKFQLLFWFFKNLANDPFLFKFSRYREWYHNPDEPFENCFEL